MCSEARKQIVKYNGSNNGPVCTNLSEVNILLFKVYICVFFNFVVNHHNLIWKLLIVLNIAHCDQVNTKLFVQKYKNFVFFKSHSSMIININHLSVGRCCCTGTGLLGVPVWGGSGSALGAGLQGYTTAAKLSGAVGCLAGQRGHSGA